MGTLSPDERTSVSWSSGVSSVETNDCKNPNFLNTIITAEKTCVHYFDFLTKRATSVRKHTGSSSLEKFRQTKSGRKVIMIIFFDPKGVYQHAIPPQIHTYNAEYYIAVLQRLRRHISMKRPELACKRTLQHDNARPHPAVCVQWKSSVAQDSTQMLTLFQLYKGC